MNLLQGKRIVLAVSGGVAAFKGPDLASLLMRDGAKVRTLMSSSAMRYITPLTFETVTGNDVLFERRAAPGVSPSVHEELAYWSEAVVVAPATANVIAKMAAGLSDDLMSSFLLATQAPVILCPSMSETMLEHPSVIANLEKLQSRSCRIVEPGPVYMACGWEERGRLPDFNLILEEVRSAVSWVELGGLQLVEGNLR